MKDQYIKIGRFLLFVLAFYLVWRFRWAWVLELLIIVKAYIDYSNYEKIREDFLENFPKNYKAALPLKAEAYHWTGFIFGMLFLFALIIIRVFGNAIIEDNLILYLYLLLFQFIKEIVGYFHQLAHPRKVYIDDNFIYFYERKFIKVHLNDIETVILYNWQIIILEKEIQTELNFPKKTDEQLLDNFCQELSNKAHSLNFKIENQSNRLV